MTYAAFLCEHCRAAKIRGIHLLPSYLPNHLFSRDKHPTDIICDKNEIRQRGGIGRAAGARAQDDRHLWNHAGRKGMQTEDFRISVQRVDTLLKTGADRIVDADQRIFTADRQPYERGNLRRLPFSHRAALIREILCKGTAEGVVYFSDCSYHTVIVLRRFWGEHLEIPIKQPFKPFDCVQFPLLVLF